MRRVSTAALAATLVLSALPVPALTGEKVALDKVPKPVLEAVKKHFPKGEVSGASRSTVDKKTVYEVSLKDGGRKIDATVSEDGKITQIEKETAFKDLPKAVAETF